MNWEINKIEKGDRYRGEEERERDGAHFACSRERN